MVIKKNTKVQVQGSLGLSAMPIDYSRFDAIDISDDDEPQRVQHSSATPTRPAQRSQESVAVTVAYEDEPEVAAETIVPPNVKDRVTCLSRAGKGRVFMLGTAHISTECTQQVALGPS